MNKKFFAVATLMLLVPMFMGAQTLKGSYFLDNSLNRNKLNPAFAPRGGYFQIPAVGNFGVGALTNFDLSTFLYPVGDQLATFLHKDVSIDQFDSALAGNPYADLSADLNVLNFGWARGKGFWTVDVGVRVNADVDISRDLFMFMKRGTGTSGVYNLGPVRANAAASVQAALGYSRDLSDLVPGLRVGAKVRGIVPAAYVGLDLDDVSLNAGTDKWTVNTHGAMHASMNGLELVDSEGGISPDFNMDTVAPAGWGMSFDLGAEYKMDFDGFINGVHFSAAFTDLGFINYSADATQAYGTSGQMDWTGMKISLEEGATDDVMDSIEEQWENMLNFKKTGENEGFTKSTLPSFYVGVEMPFCNNMMSVGALYSARRSYYNTRNELTLSYNLNPVKWFALGLNYSFLNVARTMGCILEFTPKVGPCLYLGFDYVPVEWTNAPLIEAFPYLPMSARLNFQFGLAFSLGGTRD